MVSKQKPYTHSETPCAAGWHQTGQAVGGERVRERERETETRGQGFFWHLKSSRTWGAGCSSSHRLIFPTPRCLCGGLSNRCNPFALSLYFEYNYFVEKIENMLTHAERCLLLTDSTEQQTNKKRKLNFLGDQQQTQTLSRSRFLNKSVCLWFSQVAHWPSEWPTSRSLIWGHNNGLHCNNNAPSHEQMC